MLNFLRKPVINQQAVDWHNQYHRTPDLWYLNQHARQLVFIADDFKTGKKRHELLEGQLPIHPSCYTLNNFTVWKKDLGEHSFPLPFEDGIDFEVHGWYKPEPARLQGELYAMPSSFIWKVLDIQKDNGVQFERKRASITVPYREVRFSDKPNAGVWDKIPTISKDNLRTIRAWMYVAKPDYWDDYIGVSLGTRAVPLFRHITPKVWIEEYYKF